MGNYKKVFNIYFWKAGFVETGKIMWIVKYQRKLHKVHEVDIQVPTKTKGRKSNPRGVIIGRCSHISFQTIKRGVYKLRKAVIS